MHPRLRLVERDIVSGPLDADKLDYLLRDTHYAGVKYGVYDVGRVTYSMAKGEDRSGTYLCVQEEDVSAVDQFLIARHNMTVQVYRHRVRRIVDAMLVRAVTESATVQGSCVAQAFDYQPEKEEWLNRWLALDDSTLLRHIQEDSTSCGKRMMERLMERRLLKEAFYEPLERLSDDRLREGLGRLSTRAQTARELEDRIARTCDIEDGRMVFVDVVEPGTALYEPHVDVGNINVRRRDGAMAGYEQFSQLLRSVEMERATFVAVYLPVDETDKDRKEARYKELWNGVASVVSLKDSVKEDDGDDGRR